jgi:hypothetical protein
MQDPSFDFNNPESINKLSRAAPNLAPVVVKNYQDYQTAQAEARMKALAQRDAQTKSALTELFQYNNFDEAEAAVDAKVATGDLTPQQAAAVKSRMRASPDYGTFVLEHGRSMLTPEQMTEVERGTRDTGAMIEDTAILKRAPVNTPLTVTGRTAKQLTPDQAADNARQAASDGAKPAVLRASM